MSQQEDDLRALAKIMDLLRALSIILVVANIYWFCQQMVSGWQFHTETMKILRNLDDAGKLFPCVVVSADSCFYTYLFEDAVYAVQSH